MKPKCRNHEKVVALIRKNNRLAIPNTNNAHVPWGKRKFRLMSLENLFIMREYSKEIKGLEKQSIYRYDNEYKLELISSILEEKLWD